MTSNQRLGNKFRQLRELHNFKQEFVAGVLDLSPNTYSLLEQGKSVITVERIQKLAELYKMDVADLLRLNEQTIIHHITHSSGICSENVNVHQNGIADEERELYKKTISRLEEQNDKLMILINKLSEKL